MEDHELPQSANPLASEPIGKLILKYSLPAIASSLVSSLYNIVDQVFVGNKIGELGNAAANAAFPLVMIVTTLAMTFGTGSAASFSLLLGQGGEEKGAVRRGERHDADAPVRHHCRRALRAGAAPDPEP